MKNKQLLAGLLAGTMCVTLLMGCGGTDGGSSSAETQKESETAVENSDDTEKDNSSGKKKVVLWTWATGQFDEVQKNILRHIRMPTGSLKRL